MKTPQENYLRFRIQEQPSIQLLVLLGIWLVVALVSGTLLQLLIKSWGWNGLSELLMLAQNGELDALSIDRLRWIQLLAHLSNYTLVAVLFIFWRDGKKGGQQLKLHRPPPILLSILCLGLIFTLFPIINWFYYWNTALIPDDWIAEDKLAVQQAFLKIRDYKGLLMNLLLLGGAAALGEELMFRGILQPILVRSTGKHTGVWLTGALFSVIHFQWEGFFPRLLMGVFFCYVFYYTSNLWIPILLHSFFNSIQVVISYVYPEMLQADRTPQATSGWVVLGAILLFTGLWVLLLKNKKLNKTTV